jgi:hypothetical protein
VIPQIDKLKSLIGRKRRGDLRRDGRKPEVRGQRSGIGATFASVAAFVGTRATAGRVAELAESSLRVVSNPPARHRPTETPSSALRVSILLLSNPKSSTINRQSSIPPSSLITNNQ